jgi:predicted dehydrogenase
MAPKARIGVIGTGWWSTYAHCPTLKAHPDAELAALADVRPEAVAKAAQVYQVDRAYTDYREMLDKEALDGAVVAVWHAAHYEVAKACLERGLHLLLEKPMVLRAAHARELCELAGRKGREILMGYTWHYLPFSPYVRQLLRSGALGRVQYVSDVFSSSPINLYRGDDRADRPEMAPHYPVFGPGDVYSDPERSGGGQGHLQVTHSAALMFYLTGLKPVSVMALMDNLDVRVDVVDAAIARLDNGALATVGSTGATHGGDGKLDVQIYCEGGWVDLDYIAAAGKIYYADGRVEDVTPAPDTPDLSYKEYYLYPAHLPARNFVDVVLGRAENQSPGEVGWRTVEFLEAAYRSAAAEGQSVAVASLYP